MIFLGGALRYFNVCGADARLRAGDCKKNATTLVKVAMEAAIGHRDKVKIFWQRLSYAGRHGGA